jgi:hypothetical protein
MLIDRVMIADSESKLPYNGSAEEGPEESAKGDPLGLEDSDLLSNIPEKFAIAAYPNPFNPSTVIQYDLPKAADVNVVIYDIMGRKIRTLVRGNQPAGSYRAVWKADNSNGDKVSTGIYFYRISAGNFSGTGKLLYIR